MITTPLALLDEAIVPPKKFFPEAAKEANAKLPKKKKPLSTTTKCSKEIAAKVKEARARIEADGGLPANYLVVNELKDLGQIARAITKTKKFSFDVESSGLDPWTDDLYCVSIWVGGKGYLINFKHPLIPQTTYESFEKQLGEFFTREDIKRRGFNTKFDGHFIENHTNLIIPGFDWDGYVGIWLINSAEPDKALKPLSEKYLGWDAAGKYNEQFGKKAWIVIDPLVATYYAIKDAQLHDELCDWEEKQLKKTPRCYDLMTKLEMRVHNKLYNDIEREGIEIDTDFIASINDEVSSRIDELRNEMDALIVSQGFKAPLWSSDEQLAVTLFDHLGLPRISGNSTAKNVLDALEEQHPLIPLLKEWRELHKLKTAFLDVLPALIGPDGRLHPDCKTIGSDTGRMAMQNPNLLQVPSRGKGAKVRQSFKAPEGYFLVSWDFSGQELRIQASLSGDIELTKIIEEDRDYYSEVTAIAFGGRGEDYSKHSPDPDKQEKRNKKGKPAVLALGFGAQAPKLAQIFDWIVSRAQDFINDYWKRFWGLKKFNDDQIKFGKKHGYVETILGRRKHLPYDKSLERWQVAELDRQATNGPIQGSAADQAKLSYIMCDDHLKAKEYKSKALWPIHDELLFFIHKDEFFNTTITQEIAHIMENSIPFNVKHKVGMEVYERWGLAINPFAGMEIEEVEDAA